MKYKTDVLEDALNWVRQEWIESKCYNITMNEFGKSNTPKWALELISIVDEIKRGQEQLFNEVVLINKRLDNLEKDVAQLKQDMIEIKKDIAEIKSLPTIQRELEQKNFESQ